MHSYSQVAFFPYAKQRNRSNNSFCLGANMANHFLRDHLILQHFNWQPVSIIKSPMALLRCSICVKKSVKFQQQQHPHPVDDTRKGKCVRSWLWNIWPLSSKIRLVASPGHHFLSFHTCNFNTFPWILCIVSRVDYWLTNLFWQIGSRIQSK